MSLSDAQIILILTMLFIEILTLVLIGLCYFLMNCKIDYEKYKLKKQNNNLYRKILQLQINNNFLVRERENELRTIRDHLAYHANNSNSFFNKNESIILKQMIKKDVERVNNSFKI